MTHAPKLAALEALRDGRLSPAGQRRIERHLGRCDTCRRALATMQLYHQTAAEVRASVPPSIAWDKMELALAREARRIVARRQRWQRAPAYAVLAAAAALVVIWAVPHAPEAPSADRPAPRAREGDGAPVVVAEARPITATLTLVAGRARERDRNGERSLSVGDVLVEGATIATSERSEAHLAIGEDGTGAIVYAHTEAVLAQLRDGDVTIELAHGRIASAIPPRTGPSIETIERSARFVVLASAYRIEAHVAHFQVSLEDAVIETEVAEGEVSVHRPDGEVVVVTAPGRWSSRDGHGGRGEEVVLAAADRAAAPRGLSVAHGLSAEAREWPVLRVEHPGIVEWEVAGVRAQGEGALAMRVAAGTVTIVGVDANGRVFRTAAVVGADGLFVGPGELRPEPPRMREGTYDAEDFEEARQVVRRSQRQLARCYDRELRVDERVRGRLTVRITIGLDGTVLRTRVVGGEVPEALEQCVQSAIDHWTFPPPRGGPVQIEIPFHFNAR
jgi:TonB family protein